MNYYQAKYTTPKYHTLAYLPVIYWLLLLNICGCRYFKERPIADEAIARVGDTYLYRSQLQNMMIQGNDASKDSVDIAKYQIQQWAITQLLTQTVDAIPPNRLAFIDQQVAEYRKSLLRYEAERQLSKPDTSIADSTIENYYKAHPQQWLLKEHLLYASYMIIRKEALDQYISKQLFFKADTDTAINYLQQYCAQYAHKCALQPQWLTWNELSQMMPLPQKNTADIIKNNNYETQDSLYLYRLKIEKRNPAGTTAPIEYCRPQIQHDIIYSRRLENIQTQLLQQYQNAIDNGTIEIY